jgi:hypothetical protein
MSIAKVVKQFMQDGAPERAATMHIAETLWADGYTS